MNATIAPPSTTSAPVISPRSMPLANASLATCASPAPMAPPARAATSRAPPICMNALFVADPTPVSPLGSDPMTDTRQPTRGSPPGARGEGPGPFGLKETVPLLLPRGLFAQAGYAGQVIHLEHGRGA